MALDNIYEGLVGVRSGSGVVSGCTLSLATDTVPEPDVANGQLDMAAGQVKLRFNDADAAQRLNEGGEILAVSSASLKASDLTVGVHYLYVKADGSLSVTNDATQALDAGAMIPRTALQLSGGGVCIGSVEVYVDEDADDAKKFRNLDYTRRQSL